jgi:2,4-dienoyl-CoA reductase (NADPH2)
LRNRVIMGSMHSRFELLDHTAERQAAFYVARARGGAAMIVTGGYAPCTDGRIDETTEILDVDTDLAPHRLVTEAVHAAGAFICAQILHAGRYAKVLEPVGASTEPSPINRREIRALEDTDVDQVIDSFVASARAASDAGYDGVEVMGSEGYLLTQFSCTRTNQRQGRYGGSFERRIALSVAVVARIRKALGSGFAIIFRISALDLVEGGLTADEIAALAVALERAGADMLSTGIGWHEARVPTIAHMVPRGAFRFATSRVQRAVKIPVAATNRINTPELAEQMVADGEVAAVALARPFLADPEFAAKAQAGRGDEINTCIACNQACLDYIFAERTVSCLVNPFAGREFEMQLEPTLSPRNVAVVGSGAAGLACATVAAERGHAVTMFEQDGRIGGQLNLAANVPGKEDFHETLRYFRARLKRLSVNVELNRKVSADELRANHDVAIVATGVKPRTPDIEGLDHPSVTTYTQLLNGSSTPGSRVAVIGAGGIGFDVADFLTASHGALEHDANAFLDEWAIDQSAQSAGGLAHAGSSPAQAPTREVWMLQRSDKRFGRRLALTTGWALKAALARRGVQQLGGVTYERIDDAGLHVLVNGEARTLNVDQVVLCAGQEPNAGLARDLADGALETHVIGGAHEASELDALRAIEQGTRVALQL